MTLLDAYSFQFANQSGWPAGSNGSWTHQRGAASTAIFSNEGTISGDLNNFNFWTYGGQARDVVLQSRYIPGSTGDLWALVGRFQNGHYYFADVGDGGQIIEIGYFDTSFHQLASTAFSFSASVAYQLKFRLEMAQLSVKAWIDGQPEPPNWNLQISNTLYVVAGAYGVGAQVTSGTAIQLDSFTVNTADFNYATKISTNVAAFTSDNNNNANPAYLANNNTYGDFWRSAATPTSGSPIYLAYDLSIISSSRRQNVMLVWYNDPLTDIYNAALFGNLYFNTPKSYTIDGNAAAGGGAVPSSGWTTLVTVSNNPYHSRQHVLGNISAYNWIRLNCTDINGSNLNMSIAINMDLHDLTPGLDDWLFLGDSITQRGVDHSDTTLPALINASRANRFPIYENAGIGGTVSGDGATNISSWLSITPAHYVVLAYGTNDALQSIPVNTFSSNMQTMITAVLNASKIPVVPHIPWGSASSLVTGVPPLNAKIDQLVSSNPNTLHGPDFYAFFNSNQSYISGDGIHPTDPAGYAAYRNLWASWLLANIYPTSLPVICRGRRGVRAPGGHLGSISREQLN